MYQKGAEAPYFSENHDKGGSLCSLWPPTTTHREREREGGRIRTGRRRRRTARFSGGLYCATQTMAPRGKGWKGKGFETPYIAGYAPPPPW